MKTNELIAEAASLPLEERAKVVDSLLQTFNHPDETHAAEWLAVAQRRLAELRSGQVKAVPGEEVFLRIRQRYGA
jgi:putative addiction module component (TIGR02574 family)